MRKGPRLDLSQFTQIVRVEDDWAEVEPRVTMRKLVKTLFPKIPPVVPEFTDITVGGAIMGGALESSSWKYGQFSDCCLEYELVLGNGEVVHASPKENPDLFYGVSGSYGTLGVLTLVRLRLIKAKKSVRITTLEGDLKNFYTPPSCDFLDAIRYSPEKSVTMLGNFCDDTPTLKPRFFYTQMREAKEVVLATPHYLFRYDHGAFWMGRFLFSHKMFWHAVSRTSPAKTVESMKPSRLLRFLWGRFCSSALLYRLLHSIPQKMIEESFFIHDFYTPIEEVERFLKKNSIYPIWLCPIKSTETPQIFSPHKSKKTLVNVGLYGAFQKSLDQEIAYLGGRKMLYSLTSYSEEEFRALYDVEAYDALRKKFYAEKIFPHVYDKIVWNRKSTPQKITTSETT
ncbi:MAG: FAD-binding oxidoreductase [Chlamydiales bacterium]|nr:FAD-binding oxidoreductase [Chlamydiales bacterium]